MSRIKLTPKWIDNCPLPLRGRFEHSDAICPCLYLRITANGVKTFSLLMRGERLVRRTLGRYPLLSLADARRAAMRIMREAAEAANDPAAEVKQAAEGAPVTLADLTESYIQLHLQRNVRAWRNVRAILRQPALDHLKLRPASAIEKREVISVLDGLVAAGTPHAAVNLLKALKAMFNWGIDRDLVQGNPCDRVRPPVKTTERSRILANAEIVALWLACDGLPPPWPTMVRMWLLTGQRRCEVSNMRWSEIEGDVWIIPAERVKKNRPHAVPLPPLARKLLASMPAPAVDGYVFSTDGGISASSNFAKTKAKLDELSGVSGWVLHDLRRTVRSKLAELGIPREIARKILNHEDGKVDRIYNRHEYLAEKREALERWEKHLMELVGHTS